ncbi:MAG TPA: AsnC family transcriptional regulator [Candidatus Saccharimonadales bacterium]|nr:AsnC family transcriptional regulator [Candidatus Saccharimonadales bacterium]
MAGLILDEVDLRILNSLARNSRLSYAKIAKSLNLTTKSIKTRVDKMLNEKVISRFIMFIEPALLGYNTTCTLVVKRNNLSHGLSDKIDLVGDIIYRFSILGGVEGIVICTRDSSEDKLSLLLDMVKSSTIGTLIQKHPDPKLNFKLTELDYEIIKYLLQDPRIEISELANKSGLSTKFVHRRLQKIQDNRLLRFTILPNPTTINGQIIFYMEIKVDPRYYQSVFESAFNRTHNCLVLSLTPHHQQEIIGLILSSENSFKIELMRSEMESMMGVKESNIYFPIKLEYNVEPLLKSIERQLYKKRINKKT